MLIYENGELQHTDTCLDIIEHSGVKGMKWGQRRSISRNKKALNKARALHYRQYLRNKSNRGAYLDPTSLTVALDHKHRRNNNSILAGTGFTAAALLNMNSANRKKSLAVAGLTAAGLTASKLGEKYITRKYNNLRSKDKHYLKKYGNPKVDRDIRDAYKHGLNYINKKHRIT